MTTKNQGEAAMQYRRSDTPGGTFFFTVVTHERQPWLVEPWCVKTLGDLMRHVRAAAF